MVWIIISDYNLREAYLGCKEYMFKVGDYVVRLDKYRTSELGTKPWKIVKIKKVMSGYTNHIVDYLFEGNSNWYNGYKFELYKRKNERLMPWL